ncbi:MAG: nitrate- and nitrite sensing domain-containing protein, partial [Magnetovibrio sp.]|nr:nitrate- and nitrite sensing domain-containing protein [Magnetovibrio sp.]
MLENMKIGSRIALALVLPIAGVLFFSAYSIYEKNLVFSEMESLQELAEIAPAISGVVHELQKERGTSAVYIGSKGKKFSKELPVQHRDTNGAMDTMNTALKSFKAKSFGSTLSGKLDGALSALAELNDQRIGVKGFDLTVPQTAKYYTGTIAKMLSIVEEMAVISTNAHVTKTITAYTSFLQAKERAGQERAMGGAGFGAGKFAPNIYRRITELIAEQNVLLFTFDIYASQAQRSALKDIVQGKDVDEVNRMRKIAINSIYTSSTENTEGPYWFKTITSKINKLKQVEDVISSELKAQASTIKAAASVSFYIFLIATAVLLVITAILVYTIITGITRPVIGLTVTMGTLAEGDTTVHVSGTHRGDEIGSMSQAVEVFKQNMLRTQEMTAAQEKENEVKEQKRVAMENMAQAFEVSVSGVLSEVSNASNSMQGTAESMAATAEETSKQSTIVAAAAEEASTNVETVASAAEELSSSISEISRQVSQSTEVANTAVAEVESANDKVQGLAQAAQKIGDVVALITDIADQ